MLTIAHDDLANPQNPLKNAQKIFTIPPDSRNSFCALLITGAQKELRTAETWAGSRLEALCGYVAASVKCTHSYLPMTHACQQSSVLYDAARAAIAAGDLLGALALLEQSLAEDTHFKTLELIGEVRCRLGRHRQAIIPLAAATGLNRGSRAPCLLAEAFLALTEWSDAQAAAAEALRRTPGYRRARIAMMRAERELTANAAQA